MEKAQQLQALLTEKGYTKNMRTAKGQQLQEIGVSIQDMHNDALENLAKLGWVTWFDAEGNFDNTNAHAQVVQYALSGIGVDAEVTDEWIRMDDDEEYDANDDEGFTIKLTLTINGKSETLEAYPEYRGDYCDGELLIDAIREGIKMAGVNFECLVYDTGDQTLCLLTLPAEIAEAIQKQQLLPLSKDH